MRAERRADCGQGTRLRVGSGVGVTGGGPGPGPTHTDPRVASGDPFRLAAAHPGLSKAPERGDIGEATGTCPPGMVPALGSFHIGGITVSIRASKGDDWEKIRERDIVPEYTTRCVACGEYIDYCQGHGEIGDPYGASILRKHEYGNHTECRENACPWAGEWEE